jgi:diguanylate cyclase (GGDEF)-like protein
MPRIDLPTLFMVSTALFVLVAVMFFVTWHQDRRNNDAMLHWAGAHLAGAPACVLLALRGEIPAWASIGLANTLVLLGFGLLLSGALTFEGRRHRWTAILVGPAIWLASTQIPFVWDHFSHRVILISLLIFSHAVTAGVVIWLGQRREALPTRPLVAIVLALVAVAHLSRLLLTTRAPVSESFATLGQGWTAFVAMQILLQEVLLGYALLAMVKERAESRQRRAAEVDVLTGALTRRAFIERAEARLAADPTRGAVAIFDLDRFKVINDTHGHLAGDRVLAAFAALVRARLGADDLFGRYGGEEFALFLADTHVGSAWRFAEEVRRDYAGLGLEFAGRPIRTTVSVGIAVVPMIEPNLDRLIASADAGLYVAKQSGRDRVETTTTRSPGAGHAAA